MSKKDLIDVVATATELTKDKAALVVDVREGAGLKKFPAIFRAIRGRVNAQLIFLEADDETLVHRFSETRRPHPLAGSGQPVAESIDQSRYHLFYLINHLANMLRLAVRVRPRPL